MTRSTSGALLRLMKFMTSAFNPFFFLACLPCNTSIFRYILDSQDFPL